MTAFRGFFRSDRGVRLACWLIQLYVRLIVATCCWSVEGSEHPRGLLEESGRGFVVAFWHGRLLMMHKAWLGTRPFHMLISSHVDGRIIAGAIRYFDMLWIAGSSNEGGSTALRTMVRVLRAGDCIGITPDGPDGPAMRASAGIVGLARLANAPVVPLAYATRRRRILSTWDRFHLPLPFGRGVFVWGEPVRVPANLDESGLEAYRARIEAGLNAVTAEADRRMGHEAVAPGTLNRNALRALKRAGERG